MQVQSMVLVRFVGMLIAKIKLTVMFFIPTRADFVFAMNGCHVEHKSHYKPYSHLNRYQPVFGLELIRSYRNKYVYI